MPIAMAAGLGLLTAGILFALSGRRATEDLSMKQAIAIVGQVVLQIIIAVEFALLLMALDSSIARMVTVVVAAALIGFAVLRAVRSPSTTRSLAALAGTFALSIVMMAMLGAMTGSDVQPAVIAAPADTISDPAGDCGCDPAYDISAIGTDASGTVWVATAGDIPQDATFWLWPASDPFVPVQITREADSWTMRVEPGATVDASDLVAVPSTMGIHLQLGADLGAFAITSDQGDRAPDTGYIGSTGVVASNDAADAYQQAYAGLDPGHRALAAMIAGSITQSGAFTYEAGVSAELGATRDATLGIDAGTVEFRLDEVDDLPAHLDRFTADGDTVCSDHGADPCVALWMDPYPALAELFASPSSVEIVVVDSREVLTLEAACVAIVGTESPTFHVGEFCGLRDGTIAFIDDRTAGFVAVLKES